MSLESLKKAVIEGNSDYVEEITRKLVESKVPVKAIFDDGLIPAMDFVGEQMKNGEFYVPEVIMSADAMKKASKILEPLMLGEENLSRGKIVFGTVKGDLHDIGKNLVVSLLKGGGFEVIDLGIDVPIEKFVEAIKEHRPLALGMSALLTTTMLEMGNVILALEKEGIRSTVKVMIGGAPLSNEFKEEVGADGYASDASGAVQIAKSWI